MLKKAIIGLTLLATSTLSSAAFIVSQEIITGADMTGLSVTVTFSDGSTDTGNWATISETPLNTGDPIIDTNGFVGGVLSSSWSLIQSGFTLGGRDDNGTFYGLWQLTNISSVLDITGFSLNGQPGNVAFDIVPTDEVTPGSAGGQRFVSDPADAGSTSVYSNLVNAQFNDLHWNLDVALTNGLVIGEEFRYFADTDLVTQVSAPAGLAFTLAGLALFTRRQSRSNVK